VCQLSRATHQVKALFKSGCLSEISPSASVITENANVGKAEIDCEAFSELCLWDCVSQASTVRSFGVAVDPEDIVPDVQIRFRDFGAKGISQEISLQEAVPWLFSMSLNTSNNDAPRANFVVCLDVGNWEDGVRIRDKVSKLGECPRGRRRLRSVDFGNCDQIRKQTSHRPNVAPQVGHLRASSSPQPHRNISSVPSIFSHVGEVVVVVLSGLAFHLPRQPHIRRDATRMSKNGPQTSEKEAQESPSGK